MITLAVDLTAEDLDRGLPYDPERCPLGRAINRALPPPLRAHVLAGALAVDYGAPHGLRELHLPRRLADLVRRYDETVPIRPRRFRLEIPDASELELDRPAVRAAPEVRPGGRRVPVRRRRRPGPRGQPALLVEVGEREP